MRAATTLRSRAGLWLGTILATAACGTGPMPNAVVTLSDDGGWCWYQDERAVVLDGALYVGAVAAGVHDPGRTGNIEIIRYDLEGGTQDITVLHEQLELDDHDVPALLIRPDGRLLAVYAKHGTDQLMRYRVSSADSAPGSWEPERTFERPASRGVTYSNLFRLERDPAHPGRLYNFYRGQGWDPTFVVSDDLGETWIDGARLLEAPDRPYVKYASSGIDTIHFVTTDGHPRVLDNSIYHGVFRDGVVYSSDGTPVGDLANGPVAPDSLTRVFTGGPDHVAWTTDLDLDPDGRPFMAFSVQVDDADYKDDERHPENGQDHRYYHARWNGSAWVVTEMAHAGTRLYPAESDYTGLVALVPGNPDRVFISTNADPATGEPLISSADGQRHWEIFEGVTRDGGATWMWTAVTGNSTSDNIRPIVPRWDGRVALLWLRGTLSTYTSYDLDVVGIIDYESPEAGR